MTELNPEMARYFHPLDGTSPAPTGEHRPGASPLVWFSRGGEHYVVCVRGGSAWARRVRAAGGRVVLTHQQEHYPAQLTELTAVEAATLILAHVRGRGPDGELLVPPEEVRRHLGIAPDALPGEIEAAAGDFAVFRIDTFQGTPPPPV